MLPLAAIAVGMGLANGCASAAATASVPANEVGAASGMSNMARYVGAALLVAATATVYGTATGPPHEAVVDGMVRSTLLMAIVSALGIALALCYGRHRPSPQGPAGHLAAAAAVGHTVARPGRG